MVIILKCILSLNFIIQIKILFNLLLILYSASTKFTVMIHILISGIFQVYLDIM
jgi:hypothetical protein